MLPNNQDSRIKLQQRMSSTISTSSRMKYSTSLLGGFASTSFPDHNSNLDCTSERPFYKPKWRSRSDLPVFQISTRQSSLYNNETCSKKDVVTWV
ncbi:sodium-dependent lysophosphatidylcholine symporter 1-B-like [Tachysurus ichikawai]